MGVGAAVEAMQPQPAQPAAGSAARRCRGSVLVVAHDEVLTHDLQRALEREGYQMHWAAAGGPALLHDAPRPDVIVLDLAWVRSGDRLSSLLRGAVPTIAVMAPGHSAAAQEAVAAGAQLLARPVSAAALLALIDRALAERRRDRQLAHYRQRLAQRSGLRRLIGDSPPMLRLKAQLRLLLDNETPAAPARLLLLHGERGSGRQQVARALHFDGRRRDAPFARFDGEPELLEVADGGTLYIREVAGLAADAQTRLIDLLETGLLRRAGGAAPLTIDVRIVAASRFGRDALSGHLRPELLRHLSAAVLHLPPLRERGDDVRLLARHFVAVEAEDHGTPPPALSRSALAALTRHGWPGNVRELRLAMQRALLLQRDGVIDSTHLWLTPGRRGMDVEAAPDLELRQLECDALTRALERASGNVSRAARLLGVSRDTMRYRIAKHTLGAGQRNG
jgi:two-component system, NtrC family, response regulator AtoC